MNLNSASRLQHSVFFILALLIASCGGSGEHHAHEHSTDNNPSNIHMNHNSFEQLVENFEDPERAEWQKPELVIAELGDLNKRTMGDIGAGTGYFSFLLAAQGAKVVAIDVDERFIAYMEERKEREGVDALSTRLVGYDDPGLGDAEFDVLLIVNTYHHFNDKVDYLIKCRQGLKDSGTLMIVDFKKEELPIGPSIEHKIFAKEVKKDLEAAGFLKVEVDENTLPYQYMITASI